MASNPVVNSSDDDDGEEGGGAAGVSAGEEGSSSSDYEEDCYFAFVEKSETPSFDIDDPQWIDDASFEIVDGDVTSSSSIADVSLDPRIDESCMVETEFYNKRPGNGRRKPVKGVRVKFQDLSKPYIARITNQTNYHRFLQIVKGEEPSSEQTRNNEMPEELQGLNPEEQEKQKELWSKELATVSFVYLLIPSVIAKLKVLGGYGPPAELDGLTEEEQESIKEDWSKELTTVEEEIQTLQSVLSAKMKRAQELKQKLGYSVWRDFQYDMTQGIRNVKESNVYQNVEEKVSQLGKAVVEAPIYQKTESVIKTTAEKTTSLFGGFGSGLTSGISSKLGQLKNSESFRSLEEKVGGVYENVKTKVSTSRSSSMQSFDDALREAEAAKKSGSTATTPIPEEH